MNIIQIIPGSGGSFYCGNCLRDSKFYEAMQKLGHKVVKIPMYLPLFADEHDLNQVPVFYGAISVYLKQQFSIFRNAPDWFDRLLNSKPMLKMAAHFSASTEATGLEDMTISMLLGEDGKQSHELDKMVDWIAEHCKPDIIHISNALLLGLAHKLKEKLKVPIVCSLQDEDVWVDVMEPKFRDEVWALMAQKADDVDAFVSVSDYYAGVSIDRMNLPKEKIHTIHLGVDPEEYHFVNVIDKPRNIGYISRMCHSNGMDILVDAFIDLKKKPGFEDVQLHLTGGSTGADKKFLKSIHRRIKTNGLRDKVVFYDEFEGEARMEYLEKVSVISVPVRKGEAFGIYLTEAMAAGIPIVQPNLGAFPEIVKKSQGGIIYQQNTPEELSKTLQVLIQDKEQLSALSTNARKSIEVDFNIHKLAGDLVEVYSILQVGQKNGN
ncbi:MAG: glycosyltransferase family 4 protein [Bacteroidales bacterium]|nr:glycosyltransferase family 4 protein [Bacteroidales bacterium]MCF8456090.1 glycosyltransferase family 4 protein [Bacteroidales bacterium]